MYGKHKQKVVWCTRHTGSLSQNQREQPSSTLCLLNSPNNCRKRQFLYFLISLFPEREIEEFHSNIDFSDWLSLAIYNGVSITSPGSILSFLLEWCNCTCGSVYVAYNTCHMYCRLYITLTCDCVQISTHLLPLGDCIIGLFFTACKGKQKSWLLNLKCLPERPPLGGQTLLNFSPRYGIISLQDFQKYS